MTKKAKTGALFGILLVCCAAVASAAGLQTQYAMSGDVEVDVMKAKVAGDILTVVLAYRNNGDWIKMEHATEDVHYIDKQAKKKYHLLRDDAGRYLADPVFGDKYAVTIDKGNRKMAWFKFPAPPAEVATIDLSVPGVIPFDDLPISR